MECTNITISIHQSHSHEKMDSKSAQFAKLCLQKIEGWTNEQQTFTLKQILLYRIFSLINFKNDFIYTLDTIVNSTLFDGYTSLPDSLSKGETNATYVDTKNMAEFLEKLYPTSLNTPICCINASVNPPENWIAELSSNEIIVFSASCLSSFHFFMDFMQRVLTDVEKESLSILTQSVSFKNTFKTKNPLLDTFANKFINISKSLLRIVQFRAKQIKENLKFTGNENRTKIFFQIDHIRNHIKFLTFYLDKQIDQLIGCIQIALEELHVDESEIYPQTKVDCPLDVTLKLVLEQFNNIQKMNFPKKSFSSPSMEEINHLLNQNPDLVDATKELLNNVKSSNFEKQSKQKKENMAFEAKIRSRVQPDLAEEILQARKRAYCYYDQLICNLRFSKSICKKLLSLLDERLSNFSSLHSQQQSSSPDHLWIDLIDEYPKEKAVPPKKVKMNKKEKTTKPLPQTKKIQPQTPTPQIEETKIPFETSVFMKFSLEMENKINSVSLPKMEFEEKKYLGLARMEFSDHLFLSACGIELFLEAYAKKDHPSMGAIYPMLLADWHGTIEQLLAQEYYKKFKQLPTSHHLTDSYKAIFDWKKLEKNHQDFLSSLDYAWIWSRYPNSSRSFLLSIKNEIPKALDFLFFSTEILEKHKPSVDSFFQYVTTTHVSFLSFLSDQFPSNTNLQLQNMIQTPPHTQEETPLKAENEITKKIKTIRESFDEKKDDLARLFFEDTSTHIFRLMQAKNMLSTYNEKNYRAWHYRYFLNVQWVFETFLQLQCYKNGLGKIFSHHFEEMIHLLKDQHFIVNNTERKPPSFELKLPLYNFGTSMHYPHLYNDVNPCIETKTLIHLTKEGKLYAQTPKGFDPVKVKPTNVGSEIYEKYQEVESIIQQALEYILK